MHRTPPTPTRPPLAPARALVIAGLALLVGVAGLTGCGREAAPVQERVSHWRAQARSVFGADYFDLVVVPASESVIDKPVFEAKSWVVTPELAERVAEALAPAREGTLRVAVAGASPDKTKLVLFEALETFDDGALPGLHLAYIGRERVREAVREAVGRVGGDYDFVPLAQTPRPQ